MTLSKSFQLHEFLTSQAAARIGQPVVPTEPVVAALQALCDNVLQPLRDSIGKTITITSGYRPDWLNSMIGGSKNSQHMLGEAADIVAQGYRPKDLCETIVALNLPFDQLIMEFDEWTHVSYGPKNRREVLTARRIGGKVHYLQGIV